MDGIILANYPASFFGIIHAFIENFILFKFIKFLLLLFNNIFIGALFLAFILIQIYNFSIKKHNFILFNLSLKLLYALTFTTFIESFQRL